jgi:hypothetical protein
MTVRSADLANHFQKNKRDVEAPIESFADVRRFGEKVGAADEGWETPRSWQGKVLSR